MNVVIDTNVLVSAFAIGGKPRQVLNQAIDQSISAHTSQLLLTELTRILDEKFVFTSEQIYEVEKIVRDKFNFVVPKKVPDVVTRDPDDNQVLAVVDSVKIDAIISGDKDLLSLREYKKVPIVTASEFLSIES